jgi:hypothetical protein
LVYEHGFIPENLGAFWIGNIALKKDKKLEIYRYSVNSTIRGLIING